MKFIYKWPLSSQSSGQSPGQSNILVNTQNNQSQQPTTQTQIIGSFTGIAYLGMLMYIYYSAMKNKSNKSTFYLNTLSTSFQYSEKIGTTIGIFIFLALLQGLFSSQGIYNTNPKCAAIIAFNYVFVLCLLLFMFIFPEGNGEIGHGVIALFVLCSLIINCFLLLNIYSDYYNDDSLLPLSIIVYMMVGSAILTVLCFTGYTIISWKMKKYVNEMHLGVACSELICLLLYSAFIFVYMQFPAVPQVQLNCTIQESGESTQAPTLGALGS